MNMTFELESSKTTWKAKECLSGELYVRSQKIENIKSLSLSLYCLQKGKGFLEEKKISPTTVFSGKISPYEDHRFPFSISLPNGPFSYDGTLFQVSWELRAEAKTGVISQTIEKVPITLIPDETLPPVVETNRRNTSISTTDFGNPPELLEFIVFFCKKHSLVVSLFFLIVSLYTLANWFWTGMKSYFEIVPIFMYLYFFIIIGHNSIRNKLFESRIGKIKIDFSSEVFGPGETLRCEVQVQPKSIFNLRNLNVRVLGEESILPPKKSKDLQRFSMVVKEATFSLPKSELRAINPRINPIVNFEVEGRIPHDAPFTIEGEECRMRWSARVEVKVGLLHKHTSNHPIYVLPGKMNSA